MTDEEMREQEGEDTEQDLELNEGAEDVVGGRAPHSDPDAARRESAL
jgi:hypothetical protein